MQVCTAGSAEPHKAPPPAPSAAPPGGSQNITFTSADGSTSTWDITCLTGWDNPYDGTGPTGTGPPTFYPSAEFPDPARIPGQAQAYQDNNLDPDFALIMTNTSGQLEQTPGMTVIFYNATGQASGGSASARPTSYVSPGEATTWDYEVNNGSGGDGSPGAASCQILTTGGQ
jgi:hypothetical protein